LKLIKGNMITLINIEYIEMFLCFYWIYKFLIDFALRKGFFSTS
jgi:hypothetical protein